MNEKTIKQILLIKNKLLDDKYIVMNRVIENDAQLFAKE